jgi:Immunity protein 72
MAFFDFLKPKWSAGKMSEEDRQREFWLTKRWTSYTAWKRCRDRYAVFADLLERQCKEEPIGRMSERALEEERAGYRELFSQKVLEPFSLEGVGNWDSNTTKWNQSTYADALKGLVAYDKGLAQLAQGDRGVFMHNSRGLLEDAKNCADSKYMWYYQGGPKGGDGMVYYGKYVQAMKTALLWAVENGGFGAGGLQPAMANLSSDCCWTESHVIEISGKQKRVQGTREFAIQETAHLNTLPRVPAPSVDLIVRTGEPCPVSGIYEPQVRDGLMTYMLEGQEAYRYGEPCLAPGGGDSVTWRLLWEDTRYLDGVIPDEEKDYYPPLETPDFDAWVNMEEVIDNAPRDVVITARSGELASYTGTWSAMDDLNGRVRWRKGEPLPLHHGRSVEWVFSPGS